MIKKLLGILVLGLLFCNVSYSENKTFKCVKFGYYFNSEGTLETIIWDKPEDSEHKLTILIDTNHFEDKDFTTFYGKATLVWQNYKQEYSLTTTNNDYEYRGIRYDLVTDKDINIRSGSLKKLMKKKKNHLTFIKFIRLKKEQTSNWYELNLVSTSELWMIDNFYKKSIEAKTDSYRCAE